MSIELPGDVAVDIRQPILGDSFSWAGLEPAAAKKVIVVHATAGENASEDGFSMAEQHVNGNGWGGIGVHFVVTHDNYPGRPGQTPAGAHVQYVGDLLTWRAGVANNNPGRVHIEICGLFTPGNGVPSEAQLRAAKGLIDFLISPNNILPSLNYYNQVDYHNHQAIQPAGATACPGWQNPQFGEWFGYLQNGAEPSWFNHPAPTPAPAPAPAPTPTPEPVAVPVTVVAPPVLPDYEQTYKPGVTQTGVTLTPKVVAVASADITDVATDTKKGSLTGGTSVKDLAGTFMHNSSEYVRTVYSATHNIWNGILLGELKDAPTPVTAPGPAEVQVTTPKVGTGIVDAIQPGADPTGWLQDLSTSKPFQAVEAEVAPLASGSFANELKALWEALIGVLLSPLRLIGKLTKKGN